MTIEGYIVGAMIFKSGYLLACSLLLAFGCWCVMRGGWWWIVGTLMPIIILLLITHPCGPFLYGRCPQGFFSYAFGDALDAPELPWGRRLGSRR